MDTNTHEVGTIHRSSIILRFLATAGKRGLALTEISAKALLPHGTVHRLLKQMSEEGLVFQHEQSRRYYLGPFSYELGLAATAIYDYRPVCRPFLEALSRQTEDTIYFVLRSGFDAVCIDRVEGSYPIRTLTLEVGSRRPLGVGAGGLAILSACDEDERERILAATASRLPEFQGLDLEGQRAAIETTRRRGFALIHNRVTLGVTAVAVAFRDVFQRPIGAISVGAIASRMREPRRSELVRLLQGEARRIETSIRTQRPVIGD